jgi:hypothetical protein
MPDGDSLFQTYRDKTDSLQRTLVIFLGIAFFFFFMVLMPLFSLKDDEYKLSNLYGLLNKTLDDVQYITQALSDQYKQHTSQNSNITQQINVYLNQITNRTADDKTLKKLEDPICKGFVLRTNEWINCNFNIKNEEVQGKQRATIRLNNTATSRIQGAIRTQTDLIEKSDGFLDTNKIISLRDTLANLSSTGQKPIHKIYGLEPVIRNLTQGVNDQIGNLLTQRNNLASRFKLLQTPLGGTLPLGFNEMLAVFTLALSAVFWYLAMTLRDTIRLRKTLENRSTPDIRSYLARASFWIDPKRPPGRRKGHTLHPIMAWTALAIPFLLFIMSTALILYTWYSIPVKSDKFPAFVAAIEFNKLSYDIIYGISFILFVFAYVRIIKEI